MSRKIIAVLTIVTILFVCAFAACDKKDEDNIYIDDKEYDFVTDKNGEKVLAEDGRLLVYETEKNGEKVTDKNGENVTEAKQFQPIENDGVVEDYGYILELPEGWNSTDIYGKFENKKLNATCEISVVKYLYDDYYKSNLNVYEILEKEKIECSWNEELDLPKDFKGACCLTMKTDEEISIMYFFENGGNVYKLLFVGKDSEAVYSSSLDFCKSMKLKPFAYYTDVTAMNRDTTDK